MDLIERLRAKSSAAKARYSFLVAASITLIIAGVWVTVLPARFAKLSDANPTGTVQADAKVENSLDSFLETAKTQVGNVIESAKVDGLDGETGESLDGVAPPAEVFGTVTTGSLNNLEPVQLSDVPTTTSNVQPEVITPEPTLSVPALELPKNQPTSTTPRVILIGTTSRQKIE